MKPFKKPVLQFFELINVLTAFYGGLMTLFWVLCIGLVFGGVQEAAPALNMIFSSAESLIFAFIVPGAIGILFAILSLWQKNARGYAWSALALCIVGIILPIMAVAAHYSQGDLSAVVTLVQMGSFRI